MRIEFVYALLLTGVCLLFAEPIIMYRQSPHYCCWSGYFLPQTHLPPSPSPESDLWADVLKAGANGIILKTGELLTRNDVRQVMDGRNFVFNEPILEKIVSRFMKSVESERLHKDALIHYEIDEYDERFLRHLALGYTKEMITNLRGMLRPVGTKSAKLA